jgi:DNA-binding response OmpR family regulator
MTPTNNPVVLVIEDDPDVRALLKDVLDEGNYEVVAVHDVRAALQLIRTVRVDLVTLDLDLPGLPGKEFVRMLNERVRTPPPIIVITSEGPVSREVRTQVQAVVDKPFDVDDLIAKIRALVPMPSDEV